MLLVSVTGVRPEAMWTAGSPAASLPTRAYFV